MLHYLLSVIQPAGAQRPEPEALAAIMRDVEAFNDELRAAGAWVFAGGLHDPSTATVVRVKDGETLMTDGPYIEGKELLGGLSIIQAPDLDAALEWGRKCAAATTLAIEVRPFHDVMG
ncbi:MAG TPA: YciI family protein [Streptomyces sp.]